MRDWAIAVVELCSPVPMSEEAKKTLRSSAVALTFDSDTLTIGGQPLTIGGEPITIRKDPATDGAKPKVDR
jgi:hypothetical protein